MASKAIEIAEGLNAKFPNNHDILSLQSNAFFRSAEIEQVQGKYDRARELYEQSLMIDMSLHNETDLKFTETRLQELNTFESGFDKNGPEV